MSTMYDLIVIGSGPGGEKGAAQAAYFGKRVAVIEKEDAPGGAAVHTGTLPSKTLRETALYLSGHRSRELYDISVNLTDRYAAVPHLIRRTQAIAESEVKRIRENVNRHNIDYYKGVGTIASPHEVMVHQDQSTLTLHGAHILIATGSSPFHPPGFNFQNPKILDSDQILNINRLPESLLVLGAGVIGCEYACMFAALGIEVTLADARDRILPFLDAEIADRLTTAMGTLGIRFSLGKSWTTVTESDSISCTFNDDETLEMDTLLFAAGRVGNTSSLGLENVGIEVNHRGLVEVNNHYQTQQPHIYAVGDVIGFPALASTSMEQGRVAMCHAFDFTYKQSVSNLLPFGIYTIPEVSSVGETEESAQTKELDYVVGKALFRENARGQIAGDTEGMTKLVIEKQSRKVIGCHVVGERASELIHTGQAVMHLGGTVDTFIEMVFNYPTLTESFKYAAYDALAKLES